MTDFPAATSAFPAPAPAFPAPAVPVTYGLTPAAPVISAVVPGAFGAPTPAGNPTPATSQIGLNLLSTMTGGAVGPGNDPRTWTPAEAANQTNNALARIATANPSLAQGLADQLGRMDQAQAQANDGGFWHSLMGAVGDVMHITHLDDVLELMGRSAHIVPEVIMDWGKESVWKNLGDAMSGHSDVSWDDILVEKLGMERNWFTATLGFIGDLATDPLTYATMGYGAISKEVAAQTAAKAFGVGELESVIKKVSTEGIESLTAREAAIHAYWGAAQKAGADTVEQAMGTVLKHADVGAAAAEKASEGFFGRAVGAFRAIHPDAVTGVIVNTTDETVQAGLKELTHVADMAMKDVTTIGFGKTSAKLAEDLGINKSAAEDVLRRWAKEGTGFHPGLGEAARTGKGLYLRGQASAAVLGGWRFHLSIPVLGLRLSPTRILPKFIPQMDFAVARRFMAGISGVTRLGHMVDRGSATTRDLELFLEGASSMGVKGAAIRGGYDMLQEYSPDVAKKLAGGSLSRVGSVLMSTSQQVGRVTSHLSPHAAILRGGGLGAYAAADLNRMGPHINESLMTLARTVVEEDSTRLNPTQVDELMARAFGLTAKTEAATNDKVREALDDWSRLTTKEMGYGASVDEMLANTPADILNKVDEPRLRELEDYFKGQGGGEGWRAAQASRQQLDQVASMLADHGVASDGSLYPLMHADALNSTEAARASENGAEHVRGKRYVVVGENTNANQFDQALDETVLANEAGGGLSARGLQLEERQGVSIGSASADEAARAIEYDNALRAVRDAERERAAVKAKAASGGLGNADSVLKSVNDAQVKLMDAKAKLRDLEHGGSDMVVYARNGFTVDLREAAGQATESTLPGNLPRELADQYDAVMTEVRKAANEIGGAAKDPKVQQAAKQMVGQQEDVAAIVTKKLQSMGYDHLRVIEPDGKVRLTVFHETGGGIAAARLEPHAQWVRSEGQLLGHTGRTASDAAMRAVNRSKIRNLPGGSEKWLEENIRDLSNMPLREAEAELRRRMEREGVGLAANQRAFEYSPVAAMDLHARKATKLATKKLVGHASQQLESLGLGQSVINGAAVGIHRYTYTLDTDLLDAVKKLGTETQMASDAATKLQVETLGALKKEAARASAELGGHYEQVRDAMEAIDTATSIRLSGEVAPNTAARKVAAELDQPDNQYQQAFQDAVSSGRAHDIGDGTYIVDNLDGSSDLFAVERKAAEGAPEAPPLNSTPVPEGWKLFSHETDAGNVPAIQQKGILAKPDKAEESGRALVSAYDSSQAAERLASGKVPEGRVVIEFKAPESMAMRTGATPTVKFPRTIDPGDIVGIHPPGSTRVVAVRHVNPDGTVVGAAAKSLQNEGYATKLMRAHWQAEGVFDAPDPIAAAAEQIRRQARGISKTEATIQRKVVTELSQGVGQASPEAVQQAETHFNKDLQRIINTTERTGGATYDPSTGKFTSLGQNGFAVAMREGSGGVIPAATWADPAKREAALREFVKNNPELATFRVNLGTWKDGEGNVHLDISEVVKSREEALALAQKRQQRAAYDLHAAEDVVPTGAERSPAVFGRSTDGIRKLLQQNVDEAQTAVEAANIQHAAQLEEVNRLSTMLTTETAKVRPALVAAHETSLNAAGFDRLNIPGFEDVAMTSFMAKEFEKTVNKFGGIEGIHAEFRKFNAWWKSQATYLWPGFHIRNMYGAFFNNILGGVGIRDYVFSGRVQRAIEEWNKTGGPQKWGLAKLVDSGDADLIKALKDNGNFVMYGKKVEDLTYGDMARLGGGTGILAANGRAFGETRVLGAEQFARHGLLSRVPGGKLYQQASKGAGTLTENTMRLAAFSQGLRTYGTTTEARVFTMMRHGDYADMTDFEFNTVRDLIPFYKWMRTNTPFQIHQLLESPGKLLAVQKAQGAAFVAAGMDPDTEKYRMPKWMGDSFVIPFSPDKDGNFQTVMLDLPMTDLHISAREFASSFLPAVRPVLESYIYDQSTFTGAPIDGKKIPLAGVFNVPGIRDVLEAVGFADRGPDGQLYTTDQKQNLLAVIPVFSRARNWMYADPDRTGLRMNAVASALFGVQPRAVDQQAMASNELDFYYSQVLPQLEHLRAMGYPLPTTADIEAAYGSTQAVLQKLGITPGAEGPAPLPPISLTATAA